MTLKEFFDTYPVTIQGIADRLGMKRQLLSDYVTGRKKVTMDTLKQIEYEINMMGEDINNVNLNM